MANTSLGAKSARVTYIDLTKACQTYGIAITRFGRSAVGDPRLILDMRRGRELRPRTVSRVLKFLATLEASHA